MMTSCCALPKNKCGGCRGGKGVARSSSVLTVALVGNPNCGKTTLFNALTGSRQRVGNWPGVTVECKSGYFVEGQQQVEVVDLPGVYALTPANDETPVDECIASEFMLHHAPDLVVSVVDASNLERHLYLTVQLLEMGLPVLVVLNMMDVVRARGIQIDVAELARGLGCSVVGIEAHSGVGVLGLKKRIVGFQRVAGEDQIRSLDGTAPAIGRHIPVPDGPAIEFDLPQLSTSVDTDLLAAQMRYARVESILSYSVSRSGKLRRSWTSLIDSVVLNRVLGIPIFLGVMYALFFFAINIGGAFQDFFDIGGQTIFVDGFAYLLNQVGMPTWLVALLANGVGKGITTTLTFIPVIGALFLFLAFLEDSGYMARAAFVIDRVMQIFGLPGKAFVPMIIGFGCNVPAVMAARTLENKRDRIITVMMSPFMSCGARLAIYAVFASAFFAHNGPNIVFALYLMGILAAVLTGFMLRKTVLRGESSPLVMELPSYHMPRLHALFLHAWERLKSFVLRAGKLIIPICVLIGALNAINLEGGLSLLSMLGQMLTPIFKPMGIHADNWPAAVGLLTGVLAKEVVIGTLNTLYAQMNHLSAISGGDFHFWAGLQAAWQSIPTNLLQLGDALQNPVLAKAPIHTLDQDVYGVMAQHFDGKIGAFAYLLFVLLYFPCVSTLAAMLRELPRAWAFFSAAWTTGIAYMVAVMFYQLATCLRHPASSVLWVISLLTVLMVVIGIIRWYAENDRPVGFVVLPVSESA